MSTFYDRWLGYWDEAEKARADARISIDEEDLEWVETPQDERVALLIAPENGFKTWGTVSTLAEIAPGRHTGQHKHGEEAIFVVSGEGCSVVDGRRYAWEAGSALSIPFGAVHQHFNTGDSPVRYLSAMTVHLEAFVGLHRTEQYEVHGKTVREPDAPLIASGLDDEGRRIVLRREEATVRAGGEDAGHRGPKEMPEFDDEHPLVMGDVSGYNLLLPPGTQKAQMREYMRSSFRGDDALARFKGEKVSEFAAHAAEISGILTDAPHEYGGKHAHMEAHLYILGGHGHSEVDGRRVDWKKGSALHVQGPQTVHQHFNDSDDPSDMLRIAYGIRYYFERSAKREFPYLYFSPRQGVVEALQRAKVS